MVMSQLPISSSCFRVSDSVLCDFVMTHANRAHLKEAKSGAYLLCNRANLKIFGLNDDKDVIGRTVFDVDKFMCPYWGSNYAKKIDEMDHLVKTTREVSIRKQDIFLDACNQICIRDMIKMPLIGIHNTVTSVLTMTTDLILETDLFYLLHLYKTMCASKSLGLQCFVKFLGIADLFCEDLTDKEIACLLHMRVHSSYKNTAKKLNVGIKTVETHVSHIIRKLKSGQLSTVLSCLRHRNIL